MGRAIQAMHYFRTDLQPEDIPLLDEEFDVYGDPDSAAQSTMGNWDIFMNRYAGDKGVYHG